MRRKKLIKGLLSRLKIKSPLKLMKNTFYLSWKLYSFLRYFHFCPDFLIMEEWLISKVMTLQTGHQIIVIHIFNIPRSNGNQAMTIGHLIEYSERNIFLKNLCWKWGRETSSRSFLFFKKVLIKVKASGRHLRFNIFSWTLTRVWD